MERVLLSLLVAFGACVCGQALAVLNVDLREPILRISPAALKEPALTDAEDAFGYAIALHQVEEVDVSDDRTTVANKTRCVFFLPILEW